MGSLESIAESVILENLNDKTALPNLSWVKPGRAVWNCGGEDFHYFKQKKPELHAAYIGVGTGVTPGLHDPRMTMNPESLRNGVKVLEKLILNVVG